ncbi:MAG: ABC transporter permease, partial [Bacilli bacterium]
MRVLAIVIRIMRQFFRDKRTLGLMIVAPMFVLFLMNLVFNGEDYIPTIAVSDVPAVVSEKLTENGAVVKEYSEEDAQVALEEQAIDAFIDMEGTTPKITLEGSDPTVNGAVMRTVQKALQQLQPNQNVPELTVTYLHGSEDMVIFDFFGPVLIGFFIFFFVFIIAGVSFLRERTGGTLERL